jgi:hypothetical protein
VQILGHVIDGISELPLVVSDKIQEYNKTKQAVLFLRRSKLWGDVLKVSFSEQVISIVNNTVVVSLVVSNPSRRGMMTRVCDAREILLNL